MVSRYAFEKFWDLQPEYATAEHESDDQRGGVGLTIYHARGENQ